MSIAAQAERLLPGIKPLVPEAFTDSMDGKNILSFIH